MSLKFIMLDMGLRKVRTNIECCEHALRRIKERAPELIQSVRS